MKSAARRGRRWALGLGIEPIKPNRLVRLDTMSAVVRAAEQGVGVALVPSRLSADRFSAGGLVKLFEAELTTNESYVSAARTRGSRARGFAGTDAVDLERVPGCLSRNVNGRVHVSEIHLEGENFSFVAGLS